MVERRLFEYEPNKPIGFFLDSSIRSNFQRQNLTAKIIARGGIVLHSPSGADTVLVDETKIKSLYFKQLHYSANRDESISSVVVEPMDFVQKCIDNGTFSHILPERVGMGGRAPGARKRVEYTADDEDHLCWYISRRIPYVLDGGRLSRGIYDELEELGKENPDYEWVRRHPSSSWHEHYRKNRARLDPIIQKHVEDSPPPRTALYPSSRRANKGNKKLLIKGEVIELTDGSEDDDSPPLKPSKRARIDTNSPSPAEEPAFVESEEHPSYSRDSPELAFHASEPQTPAPSPTLVNKGSQRFDEPASNRAVRSSIVPRPSTSFRNVVHSSPVLHSRLPGGDTRSNNTSRTEPSSRSLVVLSGLSHPPQTATNYPAESSILRESAHKQSSPIPAPVRKAARRPKVPIQPPSSSPSNDVAHGNTWAPYKNTRSRSRSVEPVLLQSTRKKSSRKDPVQRNDVPLPPVLEGEMEHDHREGKEEKQSVIQQQVPELEEWIQKDRTAMLTETMQEEYDVEDFLTKQSNATISGVVPESWNRGAMVEERDDDDDGDAEETLRSENRSKHRRQPLFALDSDDEAMDQVIMTLPSDRKTSITGGKGKGKERASVKEESDEEDLIWSEARPSDQRRRASFDEDDDDDDDSTNPLFSDGRESTPYTLKEPMAPSLEHPLSLNFPPSGSPLQARDQNRRATIPFSVPAKIPKSIRARQLAGPESTSLTPSSIGTLPEVAYSPTTPHLWPSSAHLLSYSTRSQARSASKSHQARRSSLGSVNSETPFPLSGTKASSVKATLEQHLKDAPYAPPSGTKAAAVMASQRSRKQRS